jgi:hypothetical protein
MAEATPHELPPEPGCARRRYTNSNPNASIAIAGSAND